LANGTKYTGDLAGEFFFGRNQRFHSIYAITCGGASRRWWLSLHNLNILEPIVEEETISFKSKLATFREAQFGFLKMLLRMQGAYEFCLMVEKRRFCLYMFSWSRHLKPGGTV
jgi:hypothetical protein